MFELCSSLGLGSRNFEEFQTLFEKKISKKYPMFMEHCERNCHELPIKYSSPDEYSQYWLPFISFLFLNDIEDELQFKPENRRFIVDKVYECDSGETIVDFLCTDVGAEMHELTRYCTCFVSLTKDELQKKTLEDDFILANTISIRKIPKTRYDPGSI